jgi:hypothetical protein
MRAFGQVPSGAVPFVNMNAGPRTKAWPPAWRGGGAARSGGWTWQRRQPGGLAAWIWLRGPDTTENSSCHLYRSERLPLKEP